MGVAVCLSGYVCGYGCVCAHGFTTTFCIPWFTTARQRSDANIMIDLMLVTCMIKLTVHEIAIAVASCRPCGGPSQVWGARLSQHGWFGIPSDGHTPGGMRRAMHTI